MKKAIFFVLILIFINAISFSQSNKTWLKLRLVPITADNIQSPSETDGNYPYTGFSANIDTKNISIPELNSSTIRPSAKGNVLYNYFIKQNYSYLDIDVGGAANFYIALDEILYGNIDILYSYKNSSPIADEGKSLSQLKFKTVWQYTFTATDLLGIPQIDVQPLLTFEYSFLDSENPDVLGELLFDFRFSDGTGPKNFLTLSTGFNYDYTSFYAHQEKLSIPVSLIIGQQLIEEALSLGIDLGNSGIEFGLTYELSPNRGVNKLLIAYSTR